MTIECELKNNAELTLAEVSKIALALKSLATYSMLAYDHEDDPEELQKIVDDGLDAVDRLFEC